MNDQTKLIVGVAAVAAIIYLVKKAEDKKAEDKKVSDFNSLANLYAIQNGLKESDFRDITRRRCTDPDSGKVIYVDGPCPKAFRVNTNWTARR